MLSKISAIVLNWNDAEATIACLESLLPQDGAGASFELSLFLVDNGSNAATRSKIEYWIDHTAEQINYIHNEQNLGFAGGMNRGIRQALEAQPDYIWLLNNDLRVNPISARSLVNHANTNPDEALLGSTMISPGTGTIQTAGGYRYHAWLGWNRPVYKGRHIQDLPKLLEPHLDYIDGASLFCRADFLARTRGLPEDFFLYFEELMLARALNTGEKMGWCRASLIEHRGPGNDRGPKREAWAAYHAARSAFSYTRRYHTFWLPSVMLARLLILCMRAVTNLNPRLAKSGGLALIDFVLSRPVNYR